MTDDFNELYDNFMKKKQKKDTKYTSISKLPDNDLPIWKEVKKDLEYNRCFICHLGLQFDVFLERSILLQIVLGLHNIPC